MASMRAFNSALRLATQRLPSGPVRSSSTTLTLPGAIFSRLQLVNQTQVARFSSEPLPRITAFEQAMQEIYGDNWRQQLNNRQRSFVKHHEVRREMRERQRNSAAGSSEADRVRFPEQRQSESEWRDKVDKKKKEIQWQKKLTWTTPTSFQG
ncbi:hypothetical protein VPNG_01471 [Cytospora leucostoma]|uniref:Uncharacterized protein n=1 Tax=Cytospora leucostoma TaxID=1230097 RepID=A0A423XKM5_9PEZI|nr:hypothetical protein VPNG_01471 [Cytospora leucostoma]